MAQSTEVCATCDGTGWAVIDRKASHCTQCDYWERRRGYAPGVPDLFQAATLAAYGKTLDQNKHNADALLQARWFVEGTHAGLYLYGGVGTGKSLLACAILNDLHKAGQRVRFIRSQELLNKLMPGADDVDQVFDQVVAVPVLVLDDVGASQGTDFARRQLLSIYDSREDKRHRTIWTSNLDLDELAEFLGEDKRLPSRIVGAAKIVNLDGPDYRLKASRRK